jgi:cell division protein ZapA
MSNVTVSIGGRHYTVACAAGEEGHIEALGRSIDGKLQDITNLSGQSEARTLLFAALLLADELHERNMSAAQVEADVDLQVVGSLESLAGRLERLAALLETEPASS